MTQAVIAMGSNNAGTGIVSTNHFNYVTNKLREECSHIYIFDLVPWGSMSQTRQEIADYITAEAAAGRNDLELIVPEFIEDNKHILGDWASEFSDAHPDITRVIGDSNGYRFVRHTHPQLSFTYTLRGATTKEIKKAVKADWPAV